MSELLLINVFNVDAALAVGRAQGLFAADGLDVDVIVTPNSTDQMRGLGKNSWQIVSTAFDNVLGWSGREGPEFVAIARVSEGGTLPVYVRPEIKNWEDLRGKALAVDAVDTAFALVLRRVLLAHGLEMERGDYSLIAKGTTGFVSIRWSNVKPSPACSMRLGMPKPRRRAWCASPIIARCCRIIPAACLPSAASGLRRIARCWANFSALGTAHCVSRST